MKAGLFCCLMLLLPTFAQAAVTFSEIAWMGDTTSANNEWIELYNNGADISVDGWVLSDGMSLEIDLVGTIPANSYVVLERNRSSGIYLGNTQFLIYTGALVNSGATLTLKRSDGSIEDQVSGGTDWQNIGGDNTTKETAQYTTSGWRTGAGTPSGPNTASSVTTSDDESTNEDDSSSGSSNSPIKSSKSVETVKLGSVKSELILKPSAQSKAYVNQMVPFSVEASGLGKALLDSLHYQWNFGDVGTSNHKNPAHIYRYPGTYVVTVEAAYAKHKQVARLEITILPVTITLAKTSAGDVQIQNNAPYDVDLSDYVLRGDGEVVMPKNTIIAAKSAITVRQQMVVSSYYTAVTLRDALGMEVATWPVEKILESENNSVSVLQQASSMVSKIKSQTLINDTAFSNPSSTTEEALTSATNSLPAYVYSALNNELPVNDYNHATDTSSNTTWPYLALLVLLVVSIGSVLATMSKTSSAVTEI